MGHDCFVSQGNSASIRPCLLSPVWKFLKSDASVMTHINSPEKQRFDQIHSNTLVRPPWPLPLAFMLCSTPQCCMMTMGGQMCVFFNRFSRNSVLATGIANDFITSSCLKLLPWRTSTDPLKLHQKSTRPVWRVLTDFRLSSLFIQSILSNSAPSRHSNNLLCYGITLASFCCSKHTCKVIAITAIMQYIRDKPTVVDGEQPWLPHYGHAFIFFS